MGWALLVAAGLLEAVWAYTMKQSAGFTRPWPTIVTFVVMAASIGMLSVSMRTLPLGTAYPVWTGIGAVGAFLAGVLLLGETASWLRVGALVLIVAGLTLMRLAER